MDYTTLALVKTFANDNGLQIPTSSDALLSMLVSGLSLQMDNYCNQSLGVQTTTLETRADVNRYGGLEFYVPSPVIQTVTGVSYRVPNSTFIYPLDVGSVVTNNRPSGSKISLVNYAMLDYRATGVMVIANYTGGYNPIGSPTLALPQDIVLAATRLVHWMYQKRNGPNEMIANDAVGALHVSNSWPTDVKQELRNYRKYTV